MIFSFAKSQNIFKSKFMHNYIGRYIVGCGLVALQGIILSFTLVKAIGICPTSLPMFYITNIFIAIVFFSIMHGLSEAIGIIGAPIMFIVLLLQIASSGGTFPIETAPAFYRAIGKVLPMTYSISTLKMIISGINSSLLNHNILVMLTLIAVFMFGGFLIRSLINLVKKEKEIPLVSDAA